MRSDDGGRTASEPRTTVSAEQGWAPPARVAEALAAAVAGCRGAGWLVNLAGPLGVGKTALLAAWAESQGSRPDALAADGSGAAVPVLDLDTVAEEELRRALTGPAASVGVDSADGPGAARLLDLLVSQAHRGRAPTVVAASRRPLRTLPGWSRVTRLVTLPVRPWPDTAIARLAEGLGIDDPPRRDMIVRLSGGLPLVADALCRSLHLLGPDIAPGAAADAAAQEVLPRLRRELSPAAGTRGLAALASVGHSDEELLGQVLAPGGDDAFAALGTLSIVGPTRFGLAVLEPYRTLLDLAHQWRHPIAHRTELTKAAAHCRTRLAIARDETERVGLTRQGLFLTGDPLIRGQLFPAAGPAAQIRPLTPGQEDLAERLVHGWARRRALNQRNCARILDSWLTHAATGFHLVHGPDGTPTGMINILPVDERTIPTIEPLLQLHTGQLTTAPEDDPAPCAGVFAGFLVCDQGGAAEYAALLHHTLAAAIRHGRLLVATPWPEVEALVRRLGFTYHGHTRHDVYACGRQGQIFTRRFTPDQLPRWLDSLTALGIPGPPIDDLQRLRVLVREALQHLADPAALAHSPLLALPAIDTVERLRATLTDAIQAMADARDPARAEAGQVLAQYYLQRRCGHDTLAHRLHLSRATYFRRLDHGLTAITRQLQQEPAHTRP